MCKGMNTTIRIHGTVQFTFFLIMRLNITITRVVIGLLQYLYLNFLIIKLENGLKKHVRNVARIKHGFVE